MEESKSLQTISKARQMLAEAKTLDDVLMIRDKAEAVRVYAAAAKLGLESQNEAAEIKIRAERKAGELLREMPKNEGTKGQLKGSNDGGISGGFIVQPPEQAPPTLQELGIEKTQSHRWQTMAELPEEEFEEFVAETKENKEELTSTAIYREAKKKEREETHAEKRAAPLPEGKYRVIYADPPWRYGVDQHSKKEQDTVLESHYPTMPLDEICALPICEMAADDCVLFLWATSPLLPQAFEVIKAWGFNYKASYVWDKVKHNVGYYNSVRHELLLIATRGSCLPDKKPEGEPVLIDSVQSIERTEHSRKPEEFRRIIEHMYPTGRKIELFSRINADGWEGWGNEPT